MIKIIQIILCISWLINVSEAQNYSLKGDSKNKLKVKRSIDVVSNSFVNSYNQFAIKSFKTLIASEEKNQIVSPFGLYSSLLSIYYGSAGITKEELREILKINNDDSLMLSSYSTFINEFYDISNEKYKFILGNSLWYQNDINISTEFKDKYANKLCLELQATDFKANPVAATQRINSWVSEKTEGIIMNILSTDDISENTQAILANTVLFDAEWLYQFDKSQTQKGIFHDYHNSIDSVYFMNQVRNYKYYENEEFKILNLPYIGGDFTLIIVLPTEYNKLNPEIPEDIFEILIDSTSFFQPHRVKVTLPKFRVENSISGEELLKKMNVKHLFSNDCDLSKLFPNEKIFVNNIFQKNLFEINEKHSVFVSTTLNEMVTYSNVTKNESVKEFRADHPFLCFLRYNEYNLILSLSQILKIQ